MHDETIKSIAFVANNKVKRFNDSIMKYSISSVFAGSYIGIGILLTFTIGGILSQAGNPFSKIVMGFSFAIALCLVIVTGMDLFTGNNFVMTVGYLNKQVPFFDVIKIWVGSYFGNLLGAILLSFIFVQSGLVDEGSIRIFFENIAIAKAMPSFTQLFMRGVLCNFLVCLAVLCSFKLQEETAKLIMTFLCLYAFVTVGFEHSIANMTVYAVVLFQKTDNITISHAIYNLLPVTLGNIFGGGLLLGGGIFSLRGQK